MFLDEVDSGLDVDAFKSVAQLLQQMNTPENCFVIITHYFSILEYLPVDEVMVLDEGHLVARGDVQLVEQIKTHGFKTVSMPPQPL